MKTTSFFLLLLLATGLRAQPVGLQAGDVEGLVGDTLRLPITVQDDLTGRNVTSVQIGLSFNGSALRIVGFDLAGTLLDGTTQVSQNATGTGVYRFAAASTVPLEGSGTLLVLKVVPNVPGWHSLTLLGDGATLLNQGDPPLTLTHGRVRAESRPVFYVYPTTVELIPGETRQFTTSSAVAPVSWRVEPEDVARISETGLLEVLRPGQFQVTATDARGVQVRSPMFTAYPFRVTTTSSPVYAGQALDLAFHISSLEGLDVLAGQLTLAGSQLDQYIDSVAVLTDETLLAGTPVEAHLRPDALRIAFSRTNVLAGEGTLVRLRLFTRPGTSTQQHLAFSEARFNEDLNGLAPSVMVHVRPLGSLSVWSYQSNVLLGETLQAYASGGDAPYRWEVEPPERGTISAAGVFTPLRGGTVRLRATDVNGAHGLTGAIEVYDVNVRLGEERAMVGEMYRIPLYLSPGVVPEEAMIALDVQVQVPALLGQPNVVAASALAGWALSFNQVGTELRVALAGSRAIAPGDTLFWLEGGVSPAAQDQTVYPQVIRAAFNEGYPTARVQGGSLTLRVLPFAPTLTFPAHQAIAQDTVLTLAWDAALGATDYEVQVSVHSNFSALHPTAPVAGRTVALTELEPNRHYYWRVRGMNASGTPGAWSDVFWFQTRAMSPAGVVLLSPAHEATSITRLPTLTWASAVRATQYEVQVSTAPNFADVHYTTIGAELSFVPPLLAFETTYYWRVRGLNGDVVGAWSAIFQFTTVDAATPGEVPLSPVTHLTALPPYPHPARGTVTIRYGVPAREMVHIVVFNGVGQQVALSREGVRDAGWHTYAWDVEALPPGFYLVRIQTRNEQVVLSVLVP